MPAVEKEIVSNVILLGILLLRDCFRAIELTTLFHSVRISATPSENLTEQQMAQLISSIQNPIEEPELERLWQHAERRASDADQPGWLPHELGAWINYRIAIVVRLLMRDVSSLSELDVFGRRIGFRIAADSSKTQEILRFQTGHGSEPSPRHVKDFV